jgi:predicted NBD/HSP70 family sugar kinase
MNIDKELEDLAEARGETAAFDVEAGRARLREAVRRLQEDPLEARRVGDMAAVFDRYEEDYRLGHEALQRDDLDAAEHYLRLAAGRGNDEAAYWLSLILQKRSVGQQLRRRAKKAAALASEARKWRLHAEDSGIAEVLDETGASDIAPALPEPSRWDGPRDVGQQVGGLRRGKAPPARRSSSRDGARYAVGIEVQPYRITAVLTNEHGEIISDKVHNVADMEPGPVVRAISEAVHEIVDSTLEPGFPKARLALGVQLGGPIDTETGTVHYLCKHPPHSSATKREFKWKNVPLGARLGQETGFQTVILNDADAFAERERWLGVGQETGDFAVMLLREGVGGAIVKDGEHFNGPVEIGQFISFADAVLQGDADTFGALETVCGSTGLAVGASDATGRAIDDLQTAVDVADEDGPGQEAAAAFTSAGVGMALAISYVVQFAGPSHVVLYAPAVMLETGHRATDAFLKQVETFKEFVAFDAHRHCQLVLRTIGINDGAHGGALAALNRCFEVPATKSAITAGSVK